MTTVFNRANLCYISIYPQKASPVPSPEIPPPQPRPRINFNPEKSLSAKLFGIDFGNAFGRPFRRGSGVTPLRGYFKTSAGIFAAGHFAKPWGRVFVTTIFAVAGTRDIPA